MKDRLSGCFHGAIQDHFVCLMNQFSLSVSISLILYKETFYMQLETIYLDFDRFIRLLRRIMPEERAVR